MGAVAGGVLVRVLGCGRSRGGGDRSRGVGSLLVLYIMMGDV